MSEKVNLKRARVVEFDEPDTHLRRFTAIRHDPRQSFRLCAIDGEPKSGAAGIPIQSIEACRNVTVLAEFPVTLADLLPEGCTRFEFISKDGKRLYSARHESNGFWSVAGDPMLEIWKFGDIAEQFDADLTTVIPLTVHPDYVEARR